MRLLNYQNNMITEIKNIVQLPNLIFLDLYANQITKVKAESRADARNPHRRFQSRRRCGRVPAQMWAEFRSDVGRVPAQR